MKPKTTSTTFKIFVGIMGITSALTGRMALGDTTQYDKAAETVTRTFLEELKGAMKREMNKGGPLEAIKVCGELAPEIANRLSRENGWRVTRVGTRIRNPLLGMPDAWEQEVLDTFAARAAKGEAFSQMNHSEIVSEPEGQYFRFMKPITVQPKCLLCHGPNETIPDSIKNVLTKHYPFDAATGYKTGDLRGAVSIKQPLTQPVH